MGIILEAAQARHEKAVTKRCKKEGIPCDPNDKKPLSFSGSTASYATKRRIVGPSEADNRIVASSETVSVACPKCGAELSFPKDYYDSCPILDCPECGARFGK